MSTKDILSEAPEGTIEAIQWSQALQFRREKSELLTKELLKKFSPFVLKQQEKISRSL